MFTIVLVYSISKFICEYPLCEEWQPRQLSDASVASNRGVFQIDIRCPPFMYSHGSEK